MRVRASAIILEEGKLLTLAYDYPKGRIHSIPGGGLQQGEPLAESVARELREELGIDVAVGDLRYVGDMMARGNIAQTVHLLFEGRIEKGRPKIDPEHTSAVAVIWLDIDTLHTFELYPSINRQIQEDHHRKRPRARYLGNCMAREWA